MTNAVLHSIDKFDVCKITNCNVLLAEDCELNARLLSMLFNQNGIQVQVAKNGREAIDKIQLNNFDIVLMDLNMPIMDGYEAAKWLAKKRPDIKIIILTMYDSEIALIRLLKAGVNGFLKKDIHPKELNHALLMVAQGEYYYSHDTKLKMASLFRKNANKESSPEKSVFTDFDIEFIKLASQEMTYKEIAMAMGISPRKIDYYRITVFEKLDIQSRIGLVIYAVKNGIIIF